MDCLLFANNSIYAYGLDKEGKTHFTTKKSQNANEFFHKVHKKVIHWRLFPMKNPFRNCVLDNHIFHMGLSTNSIEFWCNPLGPCQYVIEFCQKLTFHLRWLFFNSLGSDMVANDTVNNNLFIVFLVISYNPLFFSFYFKAYCHGLKCSFKLNSYTFSNVG